MISCDANYTRASDYWDIFTLARDRGAVAALLYTTTAMSCLINEEYIEDFEKPVDVYSTKSMSSARLIEAQFNATDPQYFGYNGSLLNESFATVNTSLTTNTIPSRTYLIATLVARVSDGQATAYPTASPSPTGAASSGRKRSTSLPMIILYCVTGIVVSLFLAVVLTGAIRALRHPERYGVNAHLGDRPPPASRAHGIGQAILDTFPVIKFNRSTARSARRKSTFEYPTYDKDPDAESSGHSTLVQLQGRSRSGSGFGLGMDSPEEMDKPIELKDRVDLERGRSVNGTLTGVSPPMSPSKGGDVPLATVAAAAAGKDPKDPEIAAAARAFAEQRRSMIQSHMAKGSGSSGKKEDTPAPVASTSEAARRMSGAAPLMAPEEAREEEEEEEEEEQCPICLLEFEEGDDVRVLPCQLAHSFHKECIDPWLLEVSSSCPLCRKDFSANDPSATTTQHPPDPHPRERTTSDATASTPTTAISTEGGAGGEGRAGGRFGRYLTFVRRERRRNRGDEEEDERARRRRLRRERQVQTGPGPF